MIWPFADLWDRALTYERFVKESTAHCELWTGIYRLAQVPDWAVERSAALGVRFRLVVLAEDWCGDATNTVPVLAKWAAAAPNVELRILRRDENPAVMDRYLTGTARSIPVAIVLTESFEELGWWGPRPAELQAFVREQRGAGRTKLDLYPEVRRWYAKDRGESTLRGVLEQMERVRPGAGASAT
jgi:hypothetical protein